MQEQSCHTAQRAARRSDRYRRVLDMVVAAVLAVATLPIVIVAAAGSAMSLRTWPFFCQERIGRNGEPFTLLKIRTLSPEVPAYIDKHELASHDIPPFCRFLRRFHLDELPQLYLVMAGRMSLVGPRPEMATLHEQMPPRFAAERTAVRPGCTGLWQVSSACADLIHATPGYDRFYLAHRTLRLDLWVLGRTALKMIGLARAVTLEEVPAWTVRGREGDVVVLDLTQRGDTEAGAVQSASIGMSVATGR